MRSILILLMLSCSVACADTLEVDTHTLRESLTNYILYVEDASHNLTISDMTALENEQWEHNSQDTFNHGYNKSSWWLKFSLDNQDNQKIARILEISYPVLDYVDLYLVKGQTVVESFNMGDKLPFNQRPVRHRHFIVPVTLEAQEDVTVYIRVQSSSSIQVPITLWEEEHFYNHDQTQTLIHGIYYGIMFVMVIYNLFVYLAVGERSYLYYVLFVTCTPLFLASMNGFAFQYIWPNQTQWNDQAIIIMLSGVVLFGAMFTYQFLNVKQLKPIFGYTAKALAGGAALIMLMSFYLPYSVSIRILIPFASLACIYALFQGIYRWYGGGLSAKYYTIAWSSLLLGGLTLALNKYTIFPKNTFTEYATQLGSAMEVILLSFALAERINQERRMRFEAQKDALDTERELRQAREHALDVQRQATESLEQRVQERTKELEELNQKLEELSDTDQLTGLKNRRYLDRVLEEEFVRCGRYQHNIAVLLMDIDHFKRFNDTYGHIIGDECLKAVANAITLGLRWPSDRPARYGGEEFCVVLPETDLEGAHTVAERIRSNVEALEFKVKGEVVPVTVSVGVSAFIPETDEEPNSIIMQSDEALYTSKENGRNQVTLYQNQEPQSIDQCSTAPSNVKKL